MSPKTRKKSHTPAERNRKGKHVASTGTLAGVMNLPVDVFFEIAAHCTPLDLLHLSRVSSELRSFIVAKRNKSMWVSARNTLDPPLPGCPEDMSEPQYASLVFERSCTTCGAECTFNSRVSYAVRVRLCGRCWKAKVKVGYTITSELKVRRDRSLMRVIFNLVPEANDNLPIHVRVLDARDQPSHIKFYQPELATTVKEYYAVVEESGEDSKALEEFIALRSARTLERLNFQLVTTRWEWDHHAAKQEAKRRASEDRRAAIEERLQDLGYVPADYAMVHEFHMLVRGEATWDGIQATLLPALAPRRATREAAEFREKYWARLSALKAHYLAFLERDRAHPSNAWKRYMPNFVEAARLPCMQALVTAAAPDVDLPEEAFAQLEGQVREAGAAYCARARRDLARIFRRDRGTELRDAGAADRAKDLETVPDDALLDSPDALFRCSSFPCNDYSTRATTVSGLLEHWQKQHPFEWNEGQRITLAPRQKRELVPTLLEALELPVGTPLSTLEDAIASQTKSLTCACGESIDHATDGYEALDRLICHLLDTEDALNGSLVQHRITLARSPQETWG